VIQRILLAALATGALAAHAAPVSFYSSEYDGSAVALSDAAPDVENGGPSADSVSLSAVSVGNDVATAGLFAGGGLMTTSADVTGATGGVVSAVSTSHYGGSFVSNGDIGFSFNYLASDSPSGTGSGDTTLFVTLTAGGQTLFSDYLTASKTFNFAAASGTTGTLDVTLTTEAYAGFPTSGLGADSGFGQVTFTSAVPEPQPALLLAGGLAAAGLFVRRRDALRK
jgi:hypothetical protein